MAKGLNLIRKDERLSYKHESGAVFHYKRLANFERDDILSILPQDERSGEVKEQPLFIDFVIMRGLLEWEKVFDEKGELAAINQANVSLVPLGIKNDLFKRIWHGDEGRPFPA